MTEERFLDDDQIAELSEVQQGDVIDLQRHGWLAHGDLPTTKISLEHAPVGEFRTLYEKPSHGVAVLTQTCDIVPRAGRDRPFVAVAPLVPLDGDEASEALRGRRPRYAPMPSYANGDLFVDLDRISTIETGVLLLHERSQGLTDDDERLRFSACVARKFSRFAFPDELATSMAKWRSNLISKHDRPASPEGELFRSAIEVRIAVVDGVWRDDAIDVLVTVLFPPGFLPVPDPGFDPDGGVVSRVSTMEAATIAVQLLDGGLEPQLGMLMCDRLETLWAQRCKPEGVIRTIGFELLGTDDMTVDVYRSSFPFDLEFLSAPETMP